MNVGRFHTVVAHCHRVLAPSFYCEASSVRRWRKVLCFDDNVIVDLSTQLTDVNGDGHPDWVQFRAAPTRHPSTRATNVTLPTLPTCAAKIMTIVATESAASSNELSEELIFSRNCMLDLNTLSAPLMVVFHALPHTQTQRTLALAKCTDSEAGSSSWKQASHANVWLIPKTMH